MNSPREPVSPSPSTPSSGSPPPEDRDNDVQMEPVGPAGITSLVTPTSSQGGQLPSPSIAKRRLATGPSHSRDSKTRKRDDGGSKRQYSGVVSELGREGRKDEFVDNDLMERLKEEFGDPFDESAPPPRPS